MIELKRTIKSTLLRKLLLSLTNWSIINVMGNVFSQIIMIFKILRKERAMGKPAPALREVFDRHNTRRRTWCGPYVVAAVCKTDYETAYQTFRKVTGKRHVAGTSRSEMRAALSEFGVESGKFVWCCVKSERKRLHAFVREQLDKKLYVVHVANHWVLVDGRDFTITDSWTAGEWKHITDSRHKNRLVKGYWPIESRPKFKAVV
jgi:hypothetical protein